MSETHASGAVAGAGCCPSSARLWLALYFPDLPLELFARLQPDDLPLALSQRQDGRDRVVRCNPAAAACGIRIGQPLQAALALDAGLRVCVRDHQAEQAALDELAHWAYQFTSQIVFEPSALLLEVGASLKLFGGLPALLQQVREEAAALGYRLQWAVAPTPMAAALLARNRSGSCVGQADLRDRLGPIPLRCLTRDRAARRLLADVGLRSIGDCLQLPAAGLARRTGPALLLLLARLLGEAPDPRRYWQPAQLFEHRIELPAEIEQQQALLFPARRLVVALCGFLRGRGAATVRLNWTLWYRDAPPGSFELGLLQPSRDAAHIVLLLRERLARLRLPAPVLAIGLRVADFQTYAELTAGLLAERLPCADRQLLERLRSRLGERRVLGLCQLPDHRPERAWGYCAPGAVTSDGAEVPMGRGARPPWLVQPPQPLTVRDGVPEYAGPLRLQGRPWRIESGWWDDFDVARDYYLAIGAQGDCLWVFRDRRSGQWFLHGLFS